MNQTLNSAPLIKDFRPFMVCSPNNYESSKAFYSALGFQTLWVESADDWFDYMTGLDLENRFPGVVITAPVVTPLGWLICYVADPSGVKLHFAEPQSEGNKTFFNSAPWMAD